MDGERDAERAIFAEHHTEGITTTSFMVRQGDLQVHPHDGPRPAAVQPGQRMPREWNDLAGPAPNMEDVESETARAALLATFDPEQIELDIDDSMARRGLIKKAMRTTGTAQVGLPAFL